MPPGRAEGGINLLHVHAVQDETLVQAYLPAVRAFLSEARRRGWRMDSVEARDRALADMLAIFCYEWGAGIQRGRNTFSGFVHVFPEHTGRLPEAARAMQAWERLGTSGEGEPICEEAWAAIIVAFMRAGDEECGLITALTFDCLFRGQDWSRLQLSDVSIMFGVDDQIIVALRLGPRVRGESTKTGSDQGVIIERGWIASWLVAFRVRRVARDAALIFSVPTAEFRARFHEQQRRLGIDVGPPHRLRHGGAACMLARGDAPTTVKLRGRWRSDKSLRRYGKTHVLVSQRASLPAAVLDLGRRFLAAPDQELERARKNSLDPR